MRVRSYKDVAVGRKERMSPTHSLHVDPMSLRSRESSLTVGALKYIHTSGFHREILSLFRSTKSKFVHRYIVKAKGYAK